MIWARVWVPIAPGQSKVGQNGAPKRNQPDHRLHHRDVATIIEQTSNRFNSIEQYTEEGFDDFEAWVEANLADGELDIIWLNGSMPRFLWPEGRPVPLAQQWLDSGNMFINVGQTFAWQSWECDGGCPENGLGTAAQILGLAGEVFVILDAIRGEGGANVILTKTALGHEYMPSLCARPPSTYGMKLADITGDWEVAASFATISGEEPGEYADPVVIHNKRTNGYLCIISQSGGNLWCSRGGPTADFINHWMPANAIGFAVDRRDKLVTSWADIKAAT